MMPVDLGKKPPEFVEPKPTEGPRISGKFPIAREEGAKPAPPMALSMVQPPRSNEERISVLEFHVPRLEASMKEGFEDLKTTCFLPMLARQDDIDQKVTAVVERDKSIRWWMGKIMEKGSQALSIAVFTWLYFKDSGFAKAVAKWWFGLTF